MQKPLQFLVIFGVFILFCDRYPPNPVRVPSNLFGVSIQHVDTDYISVQPPADGMVSTKVNVLSFRIVVKNLEVSALEFYGRAVMDGPPENRIHAVHFRTDSLGLKPDSTDYQFNLLQEIQPESVYVIVRPQYPTNEYSPFDDDRGKIISIEIDEVWAYQKNGTAVSMPLIDL
jgi:hypothetical protein